MVLNDVLTVSAGRPINIGIDRHQITVVDDTAIPGTLQLWFNNALAFPGLINSHDHLDFNLFPAFGDRVYKSYTEWGKYIHDHYKDEIAQVLKVPVALREEWGIIKNLLCGVTTVVNHGEKVQHISGLINVHERYQCLHSVGFEKKWKIKLNNPLETTKLPVVVHVGEGLTFHDYDEINQLIKWNILKKKLVGIHAVAMTDEQAQKFEAIVWCPESNYFLLNKTAPVNLLKQHTTILFGSDSTLTGDWNIWNHIRLAREVKLLTDTELYRSLNANATAVWETGNNEIKAGAIADMVIVKAKDEKNVLPAFFDTNPEDILMVIQQGNIRLFDESVCDQLAGTDLSGYYKVQINGACKYIQSDVPALMKKIKQYYPEAVFPCI
jgi:cytosine/adenosine deaminase-related metal-dependent hydrolase